MLPMALISNIKHINYRSNNWTTTLCDGQFMYICNCRRHIVVWLDIKSNETESGLGFVKCMHIMEKPSQVVYTDDETTRHKVAYSQMFQNMAMRKHIICCRYISSFFAEIMLLRTIVKYKTENV